MSSRHNEGAKAGNAQDMGQRSDKATPSPAGEFLVRKFEEAVDGDRPNEALHSRYAGGVDHDRVLEGRTVTDEDRVWIECPRCKGNTTPSGSADACTDCEGLGEVDAPREELLTFAEALGRELDNPRKFVGVDRPSEATPGPRFIDLVHAYPPGPDSSFVEAEDEDGRGMKIGEWVERQDGTWALRIYAGDIEATMLPRRASAEATTEGHADGCIAVGTHWNCRSFGCLPRAGQTVEQARAQLAAVTGPHSAETTTEAEAALMKPATHAEAIEMLRRWVDWIDDATPEANEQRLVTAGADLVGRLNAARAGAYLAGIASEQRKVRERAPNLASIFDEIGLALADLETKAEADGFPDQAAGARDSLRAVANIRKKVLP